MKIRVILISGAVAPVLAFGGDESFLTSSKGGLSSKGGMAKGGLVEPSQPSRWRVGFGFAPLLNVNTKFSDLGAYSSPLSPQPLGGGQDYNYDDGFVRLDSSGNVGDLTWNWGYENNAQYDASGTGSLSFSISNSLSNGSVNESEDFNPGFEIFGYYDMGEIKGLDVGAGASRWGFKATLHYVNISIDNSSALFADLNRTTDTFALNGVVPPRAPYSGSFNGPGLLISDNPTRTTGVVSNGATITGNRSLDVDMFGLTVGPYLQIPVTSRFAVSLEAGFSFALADGDYRFSSLTSVPGATPQASAGSGSETSILPGFSAGLNAIYQISDSWSAYGGAKYQYYSDFDVRASNSKAKLDFGSAFVLTIGGSYKF